MNNIENEFYLKSNSKATINIEITNASIRKENDTTYIIKTDNPKRSELIITQKGRTKKIYFIKANIPDAELTFRLYNYYKKGEISLEEFKKISSFSASIQNFYYDILFDIEPVEVLHLDKNNITKNHRIFDSKNFRPFYNTEIGDIYIFYNIKLGNDKNGKINGKPLFLKITE